MLACPRSRRPSISRLPLCRAIAARTSEKGRRCACSVIREASLAVAATCRCSVCRNPRQRLLYPGRQRRVGGGKQWQRRGPQFQQPLFRLLAPPPTAAHRAAAPAAQPPAPTLPHLQRCPRHPSQAKAPRSQRSPLTKTPIATRRGIPLTVSPYAFRPVSTVFDRFTNSYAHIPILLPRTDNRHNRYPPHRRFDSLPLVTYSL